MTMIFNVIMYSEIRYFDSYLSNRYHQNARIANLSPTHGGYMWSITWIKWKYYWNHDRQDDWVVRGEVLTSGSRVTNGYIREVLLHVKRERVHVTSDSGAQIRYRSRSRTLLGFATRRDVSSDKQPHRDQQMTRQQPIKHIRKQKWTYTT